MHIASVRKFRTLVYQHFDEHGRDLPWRCTRNPYHILVSEVMLQQTQVARVLGKYTQFLTLFPTVYALADAQQSDVLRSWVGLGYNRRAVNLKRAGERIVRDYGGTFPQAKKDLLLLEGVGAYTASAVRVFAYHEPDVLIETNIRTVFLHHFFSQTDVHDRELEPFIWATLDWANPAKWYSALMDYGAYLKVSKGNASKRSKHYARQSTFTGSLRQVRGCVVRELAIKAHTAHALQKNCDPENRHFLRALTGLTVENIVQRRGDTHDMYELR